MQTCHSPLDDLHYRDSLGDGRAHGSEHDLLSGLVTLRDIRHTDNVMHAQNR